MSSHSGEHMRNAPNITFSSKLLTLVNGALHELVLEFHVECRNINKYRMFH